METQENKEVYDLDRRVFRLLNSEPFFTRISMQLTKRANRSIPTAGVMYNKDTARYELMYNPEFMAGLSELHQRWVLKHELYHCALGHCEDRNLKEITKGNHKIANCAMDLAINSLPGMLSEAPEFVLIPGRAPFEQITNTQQTSEWYARAIMRDQKNKSEDGEGQPGEGQPGDGQGGGSGVPDSFDSHEDFGGANGDDEDENARRQFAADRLKDAIGQAAKECDVGDGESPAAGWGSVSASVRGKIIEATRGQTKLKPETVFRSFCRASVAASKKTSVTKRSRRLPGKKFGRRVEHRANIAISVDQSGSVSDALLAKVYEFMNGMAEIVSFTMIPFDHDVFAEKVYVWRKGEKRKRERVLYGGTDFDAPTKYVNERQFDGHIIITDMLAPAPIRSSCQRLWITDRYGARCPIFTPKGEKVLQVD